MTLERGELLHGRYRILEILGQGGMGAIYRAIDDNLGLEVAVKENLFTTEEYARQFRREATILANLRHRNLPRVSDHFVIEGQGQYLVMDYIEGEDLRERMDRTEVITEAEALVIAGMVCDALAYMHSQNPPVFHRDIKPGNVKITPDGRVFLVDFGLAKMAYEGQRTTTGARAMTPGYSPPEQYGGARTNQRSDIYSLAATLYAALAGTIPEDSLARTMEQAELTPLRAHNPNISRRFAKVVEKGLEVHPDDRYQSAKAFKKALNAASNTIRKQAENVVLEPVGDLEEPLPAKEESSDDSTSGPILISRPIGESDFEPPPKPKPNRSRGCLISLILLLVFSVIGAGLLYYFNPAFMERLLDLTSVEVVLPLPASSEPADTPGLMVSHTPSTAITEASSLPGIESATPVPSTQTLAPPTVTDTVTPTSTLTPTETPHPTESLTPTATFTPTVFLSPTKTPMGGGYGQIAFASDRSGVPQIWVINSDGSGLNQLTDIQLGACQPDWSPDGERLVFVSPCKENTDKYDTASLYLINADGSGLTALPTTGRSDYDPAWSPDGKSIAFTSLRMGYRPQVYLMNLDSLEVQRLSIEDYIDLNPEFSPDGSKIVFVTTRNGPYQIWTMNVDGSEHKRFSASGGSLHDIYPVWSHDGGTIVFTQREINGIPYLMGARYPDGGVAEFKIYPFPGSIPMREADYSPDDLWLAFESWPDGPQHDIYLMRMNAGDLTPLTTDPAFDFDPSWRPNFPW